MPVLINFKICDNAKECSGIAVCPTGALSWDDIKKTIVIDNTKCITCYKCEKSCMVDAIKVAKDQKEYDQIKQEFDNDPRKISDLFIDRYGSQAIHPAFLIGEDKFNLEVLNSTGIVAVEIFNDNSIMCLRCSIPFREIFKDEKLKYRKVKITSDKLLSEYKIKKLPSLLFFLNGKIIGKIPGFYSVDEKTQLLEKVKKILRPR